MSEGDSNWCPLRSMHDFCRILGTLFAGDRVAGFWGLIFSCFVLVLVFEMFLLNFRELFFTSNFFSRFEIPFFPLMGGTVSSPSDIEGFSLSLSHSLFFGTKLCVFPGYVWKSISFFFFIFSENDGFVRICGVWSFFSWEISILWFFL